MQNNLSNVKRNRDEKTMDEALANSPYPKNEEYNSVMAMLASLDSVLGVTGDSVESVNELKYETGTVVNKHGQAFDKTPDYVEQDIDEPNSTYEYSFCNDSTGYHLIRQKLQLITDNDELISILLAASDHRSSFYKSNKLGSKREYVAALHIILNERGVAPYFRGSKSGVFTQKGLSQEQKVESNDRQIIDLHWLHTKHRQTIKSKDAIIRELFANTEFDFELSSEYVSYPMEVVLKVKKIGISSQIQAELLTIKSAIIRKKQLEVTKNTEHAEMLLRDKIEKPNSRFPRENFNSTCEAFKCLALGDGSLTTAELN